MRRDREKRLAVGTKRTSCIREAWLSGWLPDCLTDCLTGWLNDCLTDCVQSWNSPSLRWVMLSDFCEIQDHRDVDWLLWNFPYSLPLLGSSFKLSRVSLLQWRLILAQRTLAWIQGYVYCSVTHKYAAMTRTEMEWSTTLWIWQKWSGVQLHEYDRNGVEYNSMNRTEMGWSKTRRIWQKWRGVERVG